MSEYWVSKKKHLCKYCNIYIADDAPSRQQHENGLRHKGNVERFVRGIYKAGEKQKKDSEEEKREMRRVEQAANAAFAQDVGAGIAKASSAAPIASTSKAPAKPPPKPSNPFANYSTAASLGYSDPDAERIAAELQIRRSQGVAGEWEIVASPQPPVGSEEPSAPRTEEDTAEPILKREAEAPPDDEDARAFKLRKKTVQAGLGEIYDPGLIPIKLKKKEEPQEQLPPPPAKLEPEVPSLPKWTAIQLKRPGEGLQNGDTSQPTQSTDESPPTQSDSPSGTKWAKPQWSAPLPDISPKDRGTIFAAEPEAKSEANTNLPPMELDGDIKPDIKAEEELPTPSESGPSSGSLFKKRKAPAGTGKGRRPV